MERWNKGMMGNNELNTNSFLFGTHYSNLPVFQYSVSQ